MAKKVIAQEVESTPPQASWPKDANVLIRGVDDFMARPS